MVLRRRRPSALLAVFPLLLAAGCHRVAPSGSGGETADPKRTHALLVNGGGRPATNYASHLRHLQEMQDVLVAARLPRNHTTALSSDGADPGLDLATRDADDAADTWLLHGTPLDSELRPPIVYTTSAVSGLSLEPATREQLAAWGTEAGKQVRAGDDLVLFVTDHGTRDAKDPTNNRITLWGDGQSVSVHELRGILDHLDSGVRVVTVMTQCFSGSFTNLTARTGSAGPENVCGYYSTTADRFAYGCYPENRNRDDVGYGFHFLRALRRDGDFDEAHRSALVSDDSPDVPLRTSDVYLEQVVRDAAAAAHQDARALGDVLLARAFIERTRWKSDLRLLDAIGQRYGIFSPRRLAEVEERLTVVSALADELKTHRDNWGRSSGSAGTANLDRFFLQHPEWRTRLAPEVLRNLQADQRRTLRDQLLTDLGQFTDRQEPVAERMTSLHQRSDAARALAYRMETRVGVLMRMRLLLFRIAGMQYVQTSGTADQRATLERLLACEHLRLPVNGAPGSHLAAKDAFPSFEDDVTASRRVVPGWLGVQFRPVGERTRRALSVDVGAAAVQAVYPNSPAREAGLEVGDVIVGPPGEPFTEPQQLREWVMTAAIDSPAPIEIVRAGTRRQVTLSPRAYPRVWPELPGPPKAGSAAPALGLTPYRGTPPTALASGRKTLLFFWATWCGICKTALPELVDAGSHQGLTVVAITDEEPEQLDAFFAGYQGPFPPVVAIDENRRSFLAYGVSGTPTFVLIDGTGRIERQAIGYSRAKGLEVLR